MVTITSCLMPLVTGSHVYVCVCVCVCKTNIRFVFLCKNVVRVNNRLLFIFSNFESPTALQSLIEISAFIKIHYVFQFNYSISPLTAFKRPHSLNRKTLQQINHVFRRSVLHKQRSYCHKKLILAALIISSISNDEHLA
jgi:hypothetical protein